MRQCFALVKRIILKALEEEAMFERIKLPLNKNKIERSPLVLVVDDNEDNLIYTCEVLDLFKYQYIVAKNGKAALDLTKDKIPDLVLMDIVMPKVDGISLTKLLKSNLLTSHIRVIAVTGLALSHQIEQIFNAGFDDYLCKPYFIEDLADKLNLYLS